MTLPYNATTSAERGRDMPRSRVLLVDGQASNLRVVRAMLGTDEYDIVCVDSGQAALDLVTDNPKFELVLLDVAMPDLNGIEVCRRIKSNPKTSHIAVLLCSALQAHEAYVTEGLKAGADGFQARPLDQAALHAWVKAALRINRLGREEPSAPADVATEQDVLEHVARLSHRVNDPLQAICAAADLLTLEMPEGSKNRALVDDIFTQVDRIARLVNDTSRLARRRLAR